MADFPFDLYSTQAAYQEDAHHCSPTEASGPVAELDFADFVVPDFYPAPPSAVGSNYSTPSPSSSRASLSDASPSTYPTYPTWPWTTPSGASPTLTAGPSPALTFASSPPTSPFPSPVWPSYSAPQHLATSNHPSTYYPRDGPSYQAPLHEDVEEFGDLKFDDIVHLDMLSDFCDVERPYAPVDRSQPPHQVAMVPGQGLDPLLAGPLVPPVAPAPPVPAAAPLPPSIRALPTFARPPPPTSLPRHWPPSNAGPHASTRLRPIAPRPRRTLAEPLPAHPLHSHPLYRRPTDVYIRPVPPRFPTMPVPANAVQRASPLYDAPTAPVIPAPLTVDPAVLAFPPARVPYAASSGAALPLAAVASGSRGLGTIPPSSAAQGTGMMAAQPEAGPSTPAAPTSRKRKQSAAELDVDDADGAGDASASGALERPIKKKFKGKQVLCHCGVSLQNTDRTWKRHISTKRHSAHEKKPYEQKHQCYKCERVFNREESMRRHESTPAPGDWRKYFPKGSNKTREDWCPGLTKIKDEVS